MRLAITVCISVMVILNAFILLSMNHMCNFNFADLASPDTRKVMVDPHLVDCINTLAESVFDKKLRITSGYRTPKHNRKVGGAVRSYHLKGQAIDCYVWSHSHEEVAKKALNCGFTTAIVYKSHVHLDIREKGLGLKKS